MEAGVPRWAALERLGPGQLHDWRSYLLGLLALAAGDDLAEPPRSATEITAAGGALAARHPELSGALWVLDARQRPVPDTSALRELLATLPSTLPARGPALGAVVDELLDRLEAGDQGRGCLEPTPPRLAERIVCLLPRQTAHLHDPAAGTCRLLAAAGAWVDAPVLSGSEIDRELWAMGRISLWLRGMDGRGFERADARSAGVLADVVPDAVVSHLPSDPDLALELLDMAARRAPFAVVLVPRALLYLGGRAAELRRRLVLGGRVRAVISLPTGVAGAPDGQASLLVLAGAASRIAFIDMAPDTVNANGFQRVADLLADGGETHLQALGQGLTAATVSLDTVERGEFNLDVRGERYLRLPPRRSERSVAPVRAGDVALGPRQGAALEELLGLAQWGGVAQLVGGRGTGKSTLVAHLLGRLEQAARPVVRVASPSSVAAILAEAPPPRRAGTVVILEDWDRLVLDADSAGELQRWARSVLAAVPNFLLLVGREPLRVALARGVPLPLPVAALRGLATISLAPAIRMPSEASSPPLARPPGRPDVGHAAQTWADAAACAALGRELARHTLCGTGDLADDAVRRLLQLGALVPREDGLGVAQGIEAIAQDAACGLSAGGPLPEDAVAGALTDLIWARFLAHLAGREPALSEECRAAGFEPRDPPDAFALLLFRANLTAPDFAERLFRPRDLRRMVPSAEEDEPKERVIERAFARWLAGGAPN